MASVTRREIRTVYTAKDHTGGPLRKMRGELSSVQKAAAALGITFGALSAAKAVRELVDVNTRYQKLEARLVTVEGSAEKAGKRFAELEDFAKRTPSQLDQVIDGYVKMKALGLDPTEEAMMSFSNTASAMGKDLNQMIEAVADASTGEFERLKDFGIKAKSEGDNVTFIFQGVSTTIKKEASAITGYLENIGKVQFAGAAEREVKTLGGALSNLSNEWDGLIADIGTAGANDTVMWAIGLATDGLSGLRGEVDDLAKAMREFPAGESSFAKALRFINDGMLQIRDSGQYQNMGQRAPLAPGTLFDMRTGQFYNDPSFGNQAGVRQKLPPRPSRSAPPAAPVTLNSITGGTSGYGGLSPDAAEAYFSPEAIAQRNQARLAAQLQLNTDLTDQWLGHMATMQDLNDNRLQYEIDAERYAAQQKAAVWSAAKGDYATMQQGIYTLAQGHSSKLMKLYIATTLPQLFANTFKAASGAMADTPGPIWARLAAYGAALGQGMVAYNAVQQLLGGGGSSAGGSPGYGGGTPGSPVVTDPGGSPQQQTTTVIKIGMNVPAEAVVDLVNEAGSRNYKIEYVET